MNVQLHFGEAHMIEVVDLNPEGPEQAALSALKIKSDEYGFTQLSIYLKSRSDCRRLIDALTEAHDWLPAPAPPCVACDLDEEEGPYTHTFAHSCAAAEVA